MLCIFLPKEQKIETGVDDSTKSIADKNRFNGLKKRCSSLKYQQVHSSKIKVAKKRFQKISLL
jgi:hypothetical protein